MSSITDQLLDALKFVESGGNPNAVSRAGAKGPYQFMDGTAKQFGIDPFDEVQSRAAARKYMTQLESQFGSVEKALQAYNWGPGNMRAYEATGKGAKGQPMPPETLAYAPKVMGRVQMQPEQTRPPTAAELFGGSSNAANSPITAAELFANEPKPEVSIPKRAIGAIVRGGTDVLMGGNQLGARAVEALASLGPDGNRVQQLAKSVRQKIEGANANIEAQYQNEYGGQGKGFDLPRLLANVVSTGPMAMAVPAAAGAGLLARTGIGAATGGAFGALQPVTEGNYWEEKAKQAGIGAAGGALLTPVMAGLARMVKPNTSPAVKSLMAEGITPTPGQILGGAAKRMEEGATSIPILGDFIKGSQIRAAVEMNRAAINRSLAPVGEKLPMDASGRDAIRYAGNTLSAKYNAVIDKIGSKPVDNAMLDDLSSLVNLVKTLPKDKSEQLQRIIDSEIKDRIKDGRLTGEAIKAAESNLGEFSRGYGKSLDFDQRKLGTAVTEAQSILRSWLERVSPERAPELRAVNEGWANFMRVQRASTSLGANEGVFSAAQLNNSVRALDSSRNKARFGKSEALMQDLSDKAKSVMGSTVPDSGTPYRAGNMAMLASALVEPGIPASAIAGGMLYTAPMQKAIAQILTKRPEMFGPLAQGLRRLPGPASAAISPLLAPLLENGF